MSAARPRSLRAQLTGALVALAVVPVVLVGAGVLTLGVRQVRQDVDARNAQLSREIANELGLFLGSQLVHMQEIALALEHAERGGEGEVGALLRLHLRANKAVDGLLVLGEDGRVVHVEPHDPDLVGVDLSRQPFVQAARATGTPTWSSATISLQAGEPRAAVVVPSGPRTAVGYLDLHALDEIAGRSRPAGAAVTVLDADGTVIAHPDPRLVREQVNLGTLEVARAAARGEDATAEYDLDGRRWLGSAARVPLTGWVVIVAEPAEAALAPLGRLRAVLLAVFAAAAAAAALTGVLGARRIVRPVEALTASTRRLAAGESHLELPAAAHGGAREIAELAASFQAMATAVREREQALARSERDYRTMVSTPVVAVLRTDGEGRITFANEALLRLLRARDASEVVGRRTAQFYADPSTRSQVLRAVAEHGRAVNIELRLRALDGSEPIVLVNASMDGETLTGLLVDITGLKQAAADRERLEQQLFHAQKMEAVGRLAGGVAHDFNNLLTAIVGFGNLLAEALPEGHPERANVEGILQAAGRAGHLTKSLLAYGRKQILRPAPLDLRDVVGAVEKLLGRLIGEDVALEVSLPDAPLTVVADAGQLEQVLVNLATNARDAMPAGGRLGLAADAVTLGAEDAARLGLRRGGAFVRVRVSDTGHGIPAAVLERMFEPFFTTKPAGKGTGLGLSIVDGIVKQHGGHVSVESRPGSGTTFTLLLEAAPGERVEAGAAGSSAGPGGRETILLAEDEPLVRSAFRRTLERAGYTVVEAVDGEEALQVFAAGPARFDLCLLDVVMPRKNGRETAEALARLRPGVRVLLASGYTADVLADRGQVVDGAELVAKPIAPAELLAKVRELLDRPRP